MVWKTRKVRSLARWWAEGMTTKAIAKKLGLTPYAVDRAVWELRAAGEPFPKRTRGFAHGTRIRRWSTDIEEILIARWYQGVDCTEIAKEINRTIPSIKNRVVRLRRQGRMAPVPPENVDDFLK